jgi:hypothetical protein
MHQGKQVSGASVGQSEGESCAAGLDQFDGAAFARAASQGRWSHFDEGRGGQTSPALNATGHKSALQIVIAELQSCGSATEPVNTGKVGRGFSEFVWNALAGGAGGSPGFQTLRQRMELRGVGAGCRRYGCHSSPPTLAGTGREVTHAC